MTVFLTFGDLPYEKALRRIKTEAMASGFFDVVAVKRPSDLSKAFWQRHGKFVEENRPGYGYWLWKPWLILEQLSRCATDEVLVYADAGCTVNAAGRPRFDEYCRLVHEAPSGVLAFQLPFEEKRFTKGDAFQALDAWHLADTPHVMATVIILRRCEASLRLAREWLRLAETHTLISDTPSVSPNDPAFIEHRHDQSLFSLLAKLHGVTLIDDETFCGDEHAGAVPFLSSRLRGATAGPLRGLRRDLGVRWQRARQSFWAH